ncbi:MAG TPA: SAM-dependent methyltransferase [Bacteroidia bacterium]|jgi:SAM-dependent MidA family methyltransferase|nr:SAM-dependent methyltransferase [Bacteroidia bacterium]
MENILSEIIKEKILREGPVSFRDFMEMALYYPEMGYYSSAKDKIGFTGDYYTSTTLTPVFGGLIGRQIEEMWRVLGENQFTIVEYGAGTGSLCRSILDFLKNNEKLYTDLKYCIIEKSPVMQEKEKQHLNEKVSWHDSIQTIPEIKGCVLSNELVDNFAVHRIVMEDELMEVFVDHKNDFVEILKPASKQLKDYLSELQIELPKGFRTEINLEAIDWMREIATHLKKGYVLTIDYGYPSSELYSEHRKQGTLTCFKKHKINYHPYTYIGEQDITSHVNFSALCLWGYKNGLQYCGFTDQLHFLNALGFRDYLKMTEQPGNDYFNFKREVSLTRTLLNDMGEKFKILIQQKEIPEYKLLGLGAR